MKKLSVLIVLLFLSLVTFSQTLEKGNLVGLHICTITPNEGVTMDQYLDFFINTYLPEYEKNFPGLKTYAAKGNRGENENSIGWFITFESVEARDKYWPTMGGGSEATIKAFEKLQSTSDAMQKLGSMNTVHTDWVIQ
jgi:hypothetical protein